MGYNGRMGDEYNAERLTDLGAERTRLRADLNRVNMELDEEILTATAAGVLQAEIVRRTGLSREAVAQKMLPKDTARWKRGASG
jgi:hypothetical protein